MAAHFANMDAWISPITMETAPSLEEFVETERGLALALGITRNTQSTNYFGLCAASLPLTSPDTSLPIGFQLMGAGGSDIVILAMEAERAFAQGGAHGPLSSPEPASASLAPERSPGRVGLP
ncbi:amidase family protein [Pistricoccus aurantiacus]|nr:amidase family protein [Pistricoccus aurantiacus]